MKEEVKYKVNDTVKFMIPTVDGKTETLVGTIFIVDAHGTFDYDGVSYDILVKEPAPGCLYKHIHQTDVISC